MRHRMVIMRFLKADKDYLMQNVPRLGYSGEEAKFAQDQTNLFLYNSNQDHAGTLSTLGSLIKPFLPHMFLQKSGEKAIIGR